MTRLLYGILLLVLGAGVAVASTAGIRFIDSPALLGKVDAGKLPPVAERLPDEPSMARFARPDQKIGRHGGTLRMLMARPKDVRMMVVYGYARLVRYDYRLELEPDILRKVDVDEGRVFTLHLRRGHKWSDGVPFTAEDFRYYWEDVANNETLSPTGPPKVLRVGKTLPRFEIIDDHTVRYRWDAPNPGFMAALAAPRPPFIYRPAHYLKRFHARYFDADALNREAKKMGARNWAALHNKLDNPYKFDNPDLPTLQPWIATTKGPSERFVFRRNPYFHRVDPQGRQLPYIDRVVMDIVDSKIVPAKTGTGESDLQARYLRFDNFTFLRKNAKQSGFAVHLWRIGKGAHMALYPNFNAKDPVWRKLLRDVRFRRALSLGIHRREINRVLYFGQAIESQNTVLPDSPLHRPEYREAWAAFDIRCRQSAARRDRPDASAMTPGRTTAAGRKTGGEIIVETAGESSEQADVLELVHDSLAQDRASKLYIRPSQRDVVRNRIYAGETVMALFPGLENGMRNRRTPAPSGTGARRGRRSISGHKWGQYAGDAAARPDEPPDMPEADPAARPCSTDWNNAESAHPANAISGKKCWRSTRSRTVHDRPYRRGHNAAGRRRQPAAAQCAATSAMYNWNPGAHFGIYETDTFWLEAAGTSDRRQA